MQATAPLQNNAPLAAAAAHVGKAAATNVLAMPSAVQLMPDEGSGEMETAYAPKQGIGSRLSVAQLVAAKIMQPVIDKPFQLQKESPVIQQKENNTGLPNDIKTGVENLSGFSLNDIKVHYNSDKPAQLQAHAYAQGTDIHVAPGQERHLPHEAWHVVQQKQGRVEPTLQLAEDETVDNGKNVEQEADKMNEKTSATEETSGGDNLLWKQVGEDICTWPNVVNGLEWYYNLATKKFYYYLAPGAAMQNDLITMENLKTLEGMERSEMGWQNEWKDAATKRKVKIPPYMKPLPERPPAGDAEKVKVKDELTASWFNLIINNNISGFKELLTEKMNVELADKDATKIIDAIKESLSQWKTTTNEKKEKMYENKITEQYIMVEKSKYYSVNDAEQSITKAIDDCIWNAKRNLT